MFDFETLAGSMWRVTAWESVGGEDTPIDLPWCYDGVDLSWDDVGSAIDNVVHRVNMSNDLMWTSSQLFECEPHYNSWDSKDCLILDWGYFLEDSEDDAVRLTFQVDRV